MFERLSERLSNVLHSMGKKGQLTKENIHAGLHEVRLALLEADVNFTVVKNFIEHVKEQLVGQTVEKNLTPAQHVIKIFHGELVRLLGGQSRTLALKDVHPATIMMVGLQGSGKTTSTGKLALLLQQQGMHPYLVPVDIYRPAAIEQLQTLAQQFDLPCFSSTVEMKPIDIISAACIEAKEKQCDVLLLDTAGRLHIDEPLMQELMEIKSVVCPQEILFVADAMTGQDVVAVAEEFNKQLLLTGAILTKMDGDARGGAALSICSVTGIPIKYVGSGEKLSDFEAFHPERVAGRILGMGDMLTLIEKAQSTFDDGDVEALTEKIQRATFNFEDFLQQMRRMKQLGSLQSVMKLIPGFGSVVSKLGGMTLPEQEVVRTEAIIKSMTTKERRNPGILNNSRKQRIAKGAGVTLSQVNQMIQQFDRMCQMMQRVVKNNHPGSPMNGQGIPDIAGSFGPGGLGFGSLPGIPGFFNKGVSVTPHSRSVSATKKKKDRKKHKNKKKR